MNASTTSSVTEHRTKKEKGGLLLEGERGKSRRQGGEKN